MNATAAGTAVAPPPAVVVAIKKITKDEFKTVCDANNKKPCSDYIRGCREQLDIDYKGAKCDSCREKARLGDAVRAAKKVKEAIENNNLAGPDTNERTCPHPKCRFKKPQPIDQFIGEKDEGALVKTCKTCRDNWKKLDASRDKEHRNTVAREAEAKPERKAVKKEWVENNPEKVTQNWVNFRLRKIQSDVEGYLKNNAEGAKNWRVNNPDKVVISNEKRNNDIRLSYTVYRNSADLKNVEFTLTFEEFEFIVHQTCHYCNTINEEKGFIGIDRKTPELGYVLANCAPCCTMCNYMKLTASYEIFLLRVEHIIVHNAMVEGEESAGAPTLHPDAFMDHAYGGHDYPVVFDEIISEPCYICGKCNSDKHQNGVDRFDSKLGYEVVSNCRSCCADCNYMKNKFDYDDVMIKLRMIYETRIRPFLANRPALTSCPLQLRKSLSAVVAKKSKQVRHDIASSKKILKRQALEKNYIERALHAKEAVEAAEMAKKARR